MAECDFCGQHIFKKYKLSDKQLPIYPYTLTKTAVEDIYRNYGCDALVDILNESKYGITTCSKCKSKCQSSSQTCSMMIEGKYYDPKVGKKFLINNGAINVRVSQDEENIRLIFKVLRENKQKLQNLFTLQKDDKIKSDLSLGIQKIDNCLNKLNGLLPSVPTAQIS